MEILHTGLHTILDKLVERIHLKNKAYFLEVIILLILITFLLDYILMLFRENWCWSLLGLEGINKSQL